MTTQSQMHLESVRKQSEQQQQRTPIPQKISLRDEVPGGPIILQTHPHRETLSW